MCNTCPVSVQPLFIKRPTCARHRARPRYPTAPPRPREQCEQRGDIRSHGVWHVLTWPGSRRGRGVSGAAPARLRRGGEARQPSQRAVPSRGPWSPETPPRAHVCCPPRAACGSCLGSRIARPAAARSAMKGGERGTDPGAAARSSAAGPRRGCQPSAARPPPGRALVPVPGAGTWTHRRPSLRAPNGAPFKTGSAGCQQLCNVTRCSRNHKEGGPPWTDSSIGHP